MVQIIRRFLMRLWGHFVIFIDRAPISAEEKNRLQQYTVLILLGIPTMVVFGLIHLNRGHYPLSAAIFTSCIGLVAGWYLLHRLRNGWIIYRINAVLFGFLVHYMVVVGGEGGSKILWMYTFPMIAFFLLGKKEGLIWATGLFALALACFWMPLPHIDRYTYPTAFITRFVITYAMVAIIAHWFEFFRDRYRLQMEAEHRELKNERRRLKEEIEKRREVEARTHELNQKLQTVINAIPDVISFKDRKGRNVLVNKAFESFAGRPAMLRNWKQQKIAAQKPKWIRSKIA